MSFIFVLHCILNGHWNGCITNHSECLSVVHAHWITQKSSFLIRQKSNIETLEFIYIEKQQKQKMFRDLSYNLTEVQFSMSCGSSNGHKGNCGFAHSKRMCQIPCWSCNNNDPLAFHTKRDDHMQFCCNVICYIES